MSEQEQSMGERRRRRERERAAREAAEQRPLTRRELRARETALQTGAIEIDATGEVRVIKDIPPEEAPGSASGPDQTGAPPSETTDTSGLTRRQLRELHARQQAATAGSAAEPTPARGVEAQSPAVAKPTAPVRRPVVRPPSSTGAIRSLAEDGSGLAPVVREEAQRKDDPASTGTLVAVDEGSSIDVTAATRMGREPEQEVANPGPLPTTRRSRRAAAAQPAAPETEGAEPSLDELIAGKTNEPEPFDARPSWADLPPPTPATPLTAVSRPRSPDETEVIAAEPTPGPLLRTPPPVPVVTDVEDAADVGDDDEDDEDEHRTPLWLSILMWVVLVVIGIVLGLLVWQLVQGDEGAAGATAIMALGGPKGWLT